MEYKTFPLKSLNGSSMRTMAEDHTKVYHALEEAVLKLAEASPHGRDYIGREDTYQAAREEHDEQLRSLRKMIDFHLAKAIHCFNQTMPNGR